MQMIISSVKNNFDSLIMIDVAEEISSGLKSKSETYNQNLYFVLLISKLRCLVHMDHRTYFCNLLRAPQNRALSGAGNSVLLVASGLTTLI